eukprot:scaffold200269_cov32-Tisochrysis_lutea.AAC.7
MKMSPQALLRPWPSPGLTALHWGGCKSNPPHSRSPLSALTLHSPLTLPCAAHHHVHAMACSWRSSEGSQRVGRGSSGLRGQWRREWMRLGLSPRPPCLSARLPRQPWVPPRPCAWEGESARRPSAGVGVRFATRAH